MSRYFCGPAHLSPDTLTEETRNGTVAYYRVHVRIEGREFKGHHSQNMVVRPGIKMSFEVEWLDEEARKVNYVDSSFWLVDKERDIQFWLSPKGWQLRAEGDRSQDFKLRIDGKKFEFKLMPRS